MSEFGVPAGGRRCITGDEAHWGCVHQKIQRLPVVASEAPSSRQGGVALCWRESRLFEVEETRFWGPNVVAFRLLTGKHRYYVVGCYVPPSEMDTFDHVESAWGQCPKGFTPILMGDLNVDLETPSDERDDRVAEWCDTQDITCMSRHFRQRRRKRARGRWTWSQRRLGRWISSHPDYVLTTPRGRRRLRRVTITWPRHHDTDHHMIRVLLQEGSVRKLTEYRRRRTRFPLTIEGPQTELEKQFEELKSTMEKPNVRTLPKHGWISDETWALVDRRAAMRKSGRLATSERRRLGR